MASSNPSIETLLEVEANRTLSRTHERSQRVIEPITCAIVANAMLMDGKISIGHDFICPLSQMIPEYPVSFAGRVYERQFVEGYIRDSMSKVLPRDSRTKRYVRNPLNPSEIVYTKPGDGSTVTNIAEIENIFNDVIFDVDSSWESNLKTEVDQAMTNPTTSVRTNDGK